MTVVDVFAFDLGGVLIHPPKLAGILDAGSSTRAKEKFAALMVGKCSANDYWSERLKGTPWASRIPEFIAHYRQSVNLAPAPMLKWIRDLAGAYKIGILSNNCREWADYSLRLLGDMQFDPVVISADTGFRKPDPRIYAHFCNTASRLPDQVLLIDNKEENVEAASAFGMHGIIFRSFEQAKAECERIVGGP